MSNINLNVFEKGISKLKKESSNVNIDIKQMILDIFAGNYKIEKKKQTKLLINFMLLIIPIEDIVGFIFPRLRSVYSILSTPLDEAIIIKNIVDICKEECKKYNKFTEADNYVKSEFSDIVDIDFIKKIKLEDFFENLKQVISPRNINIQDSHDLITTNGFEILDPSCVFEFSDEDYKNIIIEYLKINGGEYHPVKIKYEEIKHNVIFKEYFDINKCQRIVQNNMTEEINTMGVEALHTYNLSQKVIVDYSYLSMKTVSSEYILDNSNISYGGNKIIITYDNDVSIKLIADLLYKINSICDEKITKAYVWFNRDLIIEYDSDTKNTVQVISTTLANLQNSRVIEHELKNYFSVPKLKLDTVLNRKVLVDGEGTIEPSVQVFSERISRTLSENIEEIEIKISDLCNFIPLYNKKYKNTYLQVLEKNEMCLQVSDKVVVMKVNPIVQAVVPGKISSFYETIFIKSECLGNFDIKHLLNITQYIWSIQTIYMEYPILNVTLFVSCGQNLFISININDKPTIKILDIEDTLGIEKINKLKDTFIREIQKNNKAFKILH